MALREQQRLLDAERAELLTNSEIIAEVVAADGRSLSTAVCRRNSECWRRSRSAPLS